METIGMNMNILIAEITAEFQRVTIAMNEDFQRKIHGVLNSESGYATANKKEQKKKVVSVKQSEEIIEQGNDELMEELVEQDVEQDEVSGNASGSTDDVKNNDNDDSVNENDSVDSGDDEKKNRGRPKKNKEVKSVLEAEETHNNNNNKEPKAKKKEPKAKEPKEPKAKEPKEPKAKKPKTKNNEKILNVIETMVNDNTASIELIEKEKANTTLITYTNDTFASDDDESSSSSSNVNNNQTITYNGINYVKTEDNLVFLQSTNEHVGTWNTELESIEILDKNDNDD